MSRLPLKRKLSTILIVVIVIAIATIFLYNFNASTLSGKPQEDCAVTFVDVGQGDSTIISCGGEHALIDAGENNSIENVLVKLRELNISRLKYVIGTHAHIDHIGALDEVIRKVEVENVILYDVPSKLMPDTEGYDELLDAVDDVGTDIIWANAKQEFSIGGGKLTILAPTKSPDSLNNASIISKFEYGKSSFLFTGDAEQAAELSLIASKADISADVLKVAHHGADTSSCKQFLLKVKPKWAVIEVGRYNSNGHPSPDVLSRLTDIGAEIHRTDLCGDIVASTDGKKIWFSCEK